MRENNEPMFLHFTLKTVSTFLLLIFHLQPFFQYTGELLQKAWVSKWSRLHRNYASRYRAVYPFIPLHPLFLGLHISKRIINSFSRLGVWHNLHHSFQLPLNSSSLYVLIPGRGILWLQSHSNWLSSLTDSVLFFSRLSSLDKHLREDIKMDLERISNILSRSIF